MKSSTGGKVISIRSYRKTLLVKKAEFQSALGIDFKKINNSENTSEEDLAPVAHEESVRLVVNQVLYGQLRQVESAIQRLELGEYGSCAYCGASIASKRLA